MGTEVVKISPGQDPGHTTETLSLLSTVAAEVSLPKDNFFFERERGRRMGFYRERKIFFSSMVGLSQAKN